jgi:hypothetical protein
MVDQEAQGPRERIKMRERQIRLAQGGAGDRQGVDRVGLAVAACRIAGVGHELGRNADDSLPSAEQIGLESPRQVPAVLDRPHPLGAEPVGPADELQVVRARGGLGRAARELAAVLVDHHRRVGALVRVDPDDHHDRVASPCVSR